MQCTFGEINYENIKLCNVTVLSCVCLSLFSHLSSLLLIFISLHLCLSLSFRLSLCVCLRVMLCCVGVGVVSCCCFQCVYVHVVWSTKPKSFTLAIHWNLESLVKNYHGINELLHLIDPRRTVLLKERYEEYKKEL